ncbi:MAG: DUF6062 family protein [Sphaerochaetaceae bacterium]
MEYQLETIPVWDGMHSGGECLLCELMKRAEAHAVSYYLGSSVMQSETRVQVNSKGFCPFHWSRLIKAGKPQALALISHTYLQTTREKLEKSIANLETAKAGRKTRTAIDHIIRTVEEREAGCLICDQMATSLKRYAFTVVQLWKQDPEFRTEFGHSKGVCLPHMVELLRISGEVLDAARHKEFSGFLTALVDRNLERLEQEVLWTTQKYKAENQEASWNGCEDAHKRVVRKLIGEGRIIT